MLKLQKVLNENNVNINTLADTTGDHGKASMIKRVLDGESEVTNMSHANLYAIARGMGVTINDILEDFDLDGTTGQITTMKRTVERLRKRLAGLTPTELRDKHMIIQTERNQARYDEDIPMRMRDMDLSVTSTNKIKNFYKGKGFIMGINLDALDKYAIIDPFPYVKKDYEFINPDLPHSQQDLPDITSLNAEYLKNSKEWGKWNKKDRPKSINSFANRIISDCTALFIYTPLPNVYGEDSEPTGGDLMLALTVFGKNNEVELSEVYGCEWIDVDNHKDIVYYKSQFSDAIDKDSIRDSEKQIISELEFYKGIHSQFRKFKISK